MCASTARWHDRPSRKVRAGQQHRGRTGAHGREPCLPARGHGAGHRGYEDAHLMVVEQAGRHGGAPGAGNWSGTLLNGLLAHHAALRALPRAGIVHRLDKDTSGLMVVGKTLRGRDGAGACDRGARGAPRSTWRWRTARWQPARVQRSTRRSAATRSRACAWRWSASGKPARTDVERAGRRRDGFSARALHACTPGARTRSACTWRRAGTRWWPMRCTAARRRSA